MASRNDEDPKGLRSLARKMFFSHETIDEFLEDATPEEIACLASLIENELSVRERHKRARLYRRAKFPTPKSFEGYDFSQITFPDGYTESDLRSLEFIDRAEDFVFHGQTGRGKTHLAIAIGTACVNAGYAVRFFTAAELALSLSRASREHTLEALMKELARCDLLILDEFGYIPIDVESSRLLFQVISACYERRSVIFTTNIEFSKWGTVLGDDKLAAATIDRIVHHGRLIEFGGASHRMEEALMLGKGAESAA